MSTSTSKSKERGPNGFPIGYTTNGDLVEWIPETAERFIARGTIEVNGKVGNVLLRGQKSIEAALEELRAMFCYLTYKTMDMDGITPRRLKEIKQEMKATEKKYGREKINEVIADSSADLLEGKVSALAWVIGWDWDDWE